MSFSHSASPSSPSQLPSPTSHQLSHLLNLPPVLAPSRHSSLSTRLPPLQTSAPEVPAHIFNTSSSTSSSTPFPTPTPASPLLSLSLTRVHPSRAPCAAPQSCSLRAYLLYLPAVTVGAVTFGYGVMDAVGVSNVSVDGLRGGRGMKLLFRWAYEEKNGVLLEAFDLPSGKSVAVNYSRFGGGGGGGASSKSYFNKRLLEKGGWEKAVSVVTTEQMERCGVGTNFGRRGGGGRGLFEFDAFERGVEERVGDFESLAEKVTVFGGGIENGVLLGSRLEVRRVRGEREIVMGMWQWGWGEIERGRTLQWGIGKGEEDKQIIGEELGTYFEGGRDTVMEGQGVVSSEWPHVERSGEWGYGGQGGVGNGGDYLMALMGEEVASGWDCGVGGGEGERWLEGEIKKEIRKWKNRESAKVCNERKKRQLEQLKIDVKANNDRIKELRTLENELRIEKMRLINIKKTYGL